MKNKILAFLISMCVIATLAIGINLYNSSQAKANDDICDTFWPLTNDCFGRPVNCLCPIVVTDNIL